jgi:hypothetical protein
MNFFQRFTGAIFPPYKHNLIRREQEQIVNALINSLSNDFSDLKQQFNSCQFLGLNNWILFPDYKFVTQSFSGETLFHYKKHGHNYRISGIQIFSKQYNKFVDAEFLVNNNLITGIKIDNSGYKLSALDISKVDGRSAIKTPFEFPPSDIDKFIASLDQDIKDKLNLSDIFDIEFGNRTFFSFYDMEDGNYLAVDKNQKVYSLVHDARPMATQMKVTFKDILDEIKEGKFDKEKHLDKRYGSSK